MVVDPASSFPTPIACVMIPEDLLGEILKGFPIKTLCQLRCVCKSWNSVISSPLLATRSHSQVNLRFIEESSCVLYHQQDNTFTHLHLPFKPHHTIICMGVVHGVVCFYYLQTGSPNLSHSQFIALWNPSIRKYVAIPWPLDHPSHHHNFIGFGFDTRNNDFKVVRSRTDYYYEVYSVRDSLWRRKALKVPDHTNSFSYWNSPAGCFINGSIYWITTETKRCLRPYGLLLFDCEREEFRTMDLPEQVQDHVGRSPRVFVWGGLLTLLKFVSADLICELWTMQEDGNASTWSKVHRIDHMAGDIITKYFRLTPLNYKQGFFQWIDNLDKDAYVYEESMLLVDIGKPCDQDQEEVDA